MFATLDEQQLPPRAAFHNMQRKEICFNDDSVYAQSVWREFVCLRLFKYMQLYLTTNVWLLADVFKHFGAICQKSYKLDPAYFVSAPQFA